MQNVFETWLAGEYEWMRRYKAKVLGRSLRMVVPLTVIGSSGLFAGLAAINSGGAVGALYGAFGGLFMAAVVLSIYFAILLPGLSPAHFARKAEKTVCTLLSDAAERESFAREMIAAASDPSQSFDFEMVGPKSNHTPAWFAHTPHYACMRGGSPAYIVVRLTDVREIRPDEEKRTATTRSGNARRIHFYTLYTIGFFQTPGVGLPDQAMGFFDKGIRDRALAMLERG
mgnify:FL=1